MRQERSRSLLLLYIQQRRLYESSGELTDVKGEIERRKNALAGGRAIRSEITSVRQWYVAFAAKEITLEQAPPEAIRAAGDLVKFVSKEARQYLDKLKWEDPDCEYKTFKAQVKVILGPRKLTNIARGVTHREIQRKHKDRVRSALALAVKLGVVPEPREKGDAHPRSQKTPDELKEEKARKSAKRKSNLHDRENRLEILARLCAWYAGVLCDHPEVNWNTYPPEEWQASDKLRHWIRLLEMG